MLVLTDSLAQQPPPGARVELRSSSAALAWYPVEDLRDAIAHLDRVARRANASDVCIVLVEPNGMEIVLADGRRR
jgi:hypothetical protein